MNFDWNKYHRGHNRVVTGAGGTLFITCIDCGVTAEIESISAKISAADAYLEDADKAKRKAQGAISPGLSFEGVIEK